MRIGLVGAVASLVATQAVAQISSCSGNGGNGHLETTPLAVGTTVTLSLTGGAGEPFSMSVSNPGFTPIPGLGTVCIDLATLTEVLTGIVPPSGQIDFAFGIPNTPAWLAFATYLQGAVVDPAAPAGFALTNTLRIDFELPDSWVPVTPALQAGRAFATATLLPSGWVLVAGGGAFSASNSTAPSGATDLYVPLNRGFIPGPPMLQPRMLHTATLLADGRVLLAGGLIPGLFGQGQETATCEIYDPATGAFSPAASMSTARQNQSATRLADGRVLVVGGTSILTPTTGEVYDPVADTWTPVANTLSVTRSFSGVARLGDGRVLVASGMSAASSCFVTLQPTPACDFYDPAINQFSPAPAVPGSGVWNSAATTLGDGTVFVSGGQHAAPDCMGTPNPASNETWVFDGAAWSAGPNLPAAVTLHRHVLLKNGGVLITGGAGATTPPLVFASSNFSSQTARFMGGAMQSKASLLQGRYGHVAVRLEDGSVLIAGGYTTAPTTTNMSSAAALYMPDP